MQDLRQIPRWQIYQKARYNLSKSLSWDDCYLEDINLKGMRISIPQYLPLQKPVSISLYLQDGSSLRIEGVPCWEKNSSANGHYSYGIFFTRVFEEDKDRIEQFIQKYCRDQIKENWWKD